MEELELAFKFLGLHPGSLIIFATVVALLAYYFKAISTRVYGVERKLGIVQNGRTSEQVVTNADLVKALDEFMEKMDVRFKDMRVCELAHETVDRRLNKLEKYEDELRKKRDA